VEKKEETRFPLNEDKGFFNELVSHKRIGPFSLGLFLLKKNVYEPL
jgi:hypothetical protein